ncbi:MAG: hypothetical protein L0J35_05580 [Tetragenococcus halophilus]|nr:hypothetical protein [Tetragenococcus halophilus]
MSKTLEKLIAKAEVKGFARLNGRKHDYPHIGKLEEKYAVKIEDNTVTLGHWGTQTLKIDTRNKKVLNIYGVSNSDRDSVNYVLGKFDMPYHVHFYPSRYEFELHSDKTDEVLKVI